MPLHSFPSNLISDSTWHFNFRLKFLHSTSQRDTLFHCRDRCSKNAPPETLLNQTWPEHMAAEPSAAAYTHETASLGTTSPSKAPSGTDCLLYQKRGLELFCVLSVHFKATKSIKAHSWVKQLSTVTLWATLYNQFFNYGQSLMRSLRTSIYTMPYICCWKRLPLLWDELMFKPTSVPFLSTLNNCIQMFILSASGG